MSSSELPDNAPAPRQCHVVKWADFDGYGFNLHADKSKIGQFIGKVDENSPAEKAGLLEGDRIVEVNGVNISNENHQQVVQRIKLVTNETRLLVLSPEADKFYKSHNIVVGADQSNVVFGTSRLSEEPQEEPTNPEEDSKSDVITDVINTEIEVTKIDDVIIKEDTSHVTSNGDVTGEDSRSVASEAESSHSGGSSTQPQDSSALSPTIMVTKAPEFVEPQELPKTPELERLVRRDSTLSPDDVIDDVIDDGEKPPHKEKDSDSEAVNETKENESKTEVDEVVEELVNLSNEKEAEMRNEAEKKNEADQRYEIEDVEVEIEKDNEEVVKTEDEDRVDGKSTASDDLLPGKVSSPQTMADHADSSVTGRRGSVSSSNSSLGSPSATPSPVNPDDEDRKSPMSTTPTPPPSIDPLVSQSTVLNDNHSTANTNHNSTSETTTTTSPPPIVFVHENGTKHVNNKFDGLNLNMTVAEMKAHLASKKKTDPRKNSNMDLKKKYEIIQNL